MKKTITIGENDVTFECSAVTPALYKAEFKRDFFGDLIKMSKTMPTADIREINYDDLEHVDFDVLGRLAFICYKTAFPKTKKSYLDWLTANPEFSVLEHGVKIAELVMENLETKKK